MLLVKTDLRPSSIHGIGVFATDFIPAGTVVWRFQPDFDFRVTEESVAALPEAARARLLHYSAKWGGGYVISADDSRFINHSSGAANLRTLDEPDVDISTRDIQAGEELLEDYREFDDTFAGRRIERGVEAIEPAPSEVAAALHGVDLDRCDSSGYFGARTGNCTPDDPCRLHLIVQRLHPFGLPLPGFWTAAGGETEQGELRGEHLVWWLCQEDMETIGEPLESWPRYLASEYADMQGRAGRGRLWIAHGMSGTIAPWPDSPMGRRLAVAYGGIVIEATHADLLRDLPGIITDLRLNRPVSETSGGEGQDHIRHAAKSVEGQACECPHKKALEKHRHTWDCLQYAARTGKTLCIAECADSYAAALNAPCPSEGLPEIPCCPPHEAMWRAGTTKPLDNCFVCIRNERDELVAECGSLRAELAKRDADKESMTYGDLVMRFPAIGEAIVSHEWDNRNISEQRDWALAELAASRETATTLRRRIHQAEGHNQFFERCESGWCNPSPKADPATEGVGKSWKTPAEYETALAASRERERIYREQVKILRDRALQLTSAMETCHICGALLLVDEGPSHCEDGCSHDCGDHDSPDCESITDLHASLKSASALATPEGTK